MPGEHDSHSMNEGITVEAGTEQAKALCFLYANDDYGFRPVDVREYTSLALTIADKALERLLEKDLVGKTHDGYYHALDDPYVAAHAEELAAGENYTLNVGKEEYPQR